MHFLHTCIRVKDLEASVAFYTTAFDFKEVRRLDFPDQQFTLVYLALEGDEDYELELTYNYGHAAYELGDGYGHVAVGVEDLVATHAKHEAAGYQVTNLSGIPGGPKMFYFVHDPDGYKIEVIQESAFFTNRK